MLKSPQEVERLYEARYLTWYDLHRKETGYFPVEKEKISFTKSFINEIRKADREAMVGDLIKEINERISIITNGSGTTQKEMGDIYADTQHMQVLELRNIIKSLKSKLKS